MDQHPVPRQITTFEFKLIGFMTLKQFIFLLIFIPLGFIAYYLFPIPVLNIFLGLVIGGIGILFAFFPIYDRPLDLWIKDLYKQLTRPTQYFFSKKNKPVYYFDDLFFVSDPRQTAAHIESQEKLTAYLAKTQKKQREIGQSNTKKQKINFLFSNKSKTKGKNSEAAQLQNKTATSGKVNTYIIGKKKPFLTGIVKNHKLIPLPGVLIYIKDANSKILRLLKTNPHGVFATFNPLPAGEYFIELKDPNENFFFDTMKISIDSTNQKPLEFYSKELI